MTRSTTRQSRTKKTAELLHEATQLLKSLKVQPKIQVMQVSNLDHADSEMALIDSGATHGLRTAHNQAEWDEAEPANVQLASGSTSDFKLKKGTRILLGHPDGVSSVIVPMGALNDLDFRVTWSSNMCRIRDDDGRELNVTVVNGCPTIPRDEGLKLLEWLEGYQLHQRQKLAVIKKLLTAPDGLDKGQLNVEVAFTAKLRQHFPKLPDEVMERIVPYLGMLEAESVGNKLPWNRHKRRRLAKAKHIVIHCFSGPDQAYWDRHCGSASTEVLCIDTTCSTAANLHDKYVFGYVLMLCASGRVRAVLGGPPCRTLSALRYQGDDGPGILRNDEFPYGLPSLNAADHELVLGDTVLMFRFWAFYIMAEEVREVSMPPTQFFMEQPEDPAHYRSQQEVQRHGYFSIFRTQEWQDFAWIYNLHLVNFDQFPMGHAKRKPTTLATNEVTMMQLNGIRGAPPNESQLTNDYKAMPLEKRCETSKSWSAWAPGLKLAIATTINQGIQLLDKENAANVSSAAKGQPASLPEPNAGPRTTQEPFSVQQLGPDSVQNLEPDSEQLLAQDPMQIPGLASARSPRPALAQPRVGQGQQQHQRKLQALGIVALDQWRRHFLNDHMPARRDCAQCVRAQARSKPHRRIQHADAYTLSVDLSGKLSPGDDQLAKGCRYLMVGCYTYPVHRDGRSLIQVPGQPDVDEDQPLPGLDVDISEDEAMTDNVEGILPEEDELREETEDTPTTRRAKSMNDTWLKLVETSKDVTVRQLTFVHPVKSRAVKHLLPALSRLHARIRALGLPVYRVHSDRAREFSSAETQAWAAERSILTTMTSGSSFKANGRVEAEMGVIKKAIRTLISSGDCTLTQWPLAARHLGERRLRRQLNALGWPVGRLLKFGAKAYALRKSWQSRYAPWRETREEVTILGPDVYSSLTNTGYYVKSAATGRYFFTDDIIIPEAQQPAVEDQVIYLPERVEDQPRRRQRQKAPQPIVSMLDIEGETKITTRHPDLFEPDVASHYGASSDSWSLATEAASTDSSPTVPNFEAEDWWIGVGELEEAPNNRVGGSYPVASQKQHAALRTLHVNLTQYVGEELERLDGTSSQQAWWLGAVSDAIHMKQLVEQRLQDMEAQDLEVVQQNLEQEFLVSKTISNQEVWNNLEAWSTSIQQEYNQLIHKKKAVRQLTRDELRDLASQLGLPIETLPGKMVHVRKCGGAYKSRAVICGNYAHQDHDPSHDNSNYAGGVDGQQVRTMVKISAMNQWVLGSTDIRTAFLNAPRRDQNRLIAMEIPTVFKKLGLAGHNHIWLVDKALYGLTSSPRDWSLYRDETIPTMSWHRQRHGRDVKGSFQKTPDENIWRLIEKDEITGEAHWVGLMSVYVDDLLISAEEETLENAVKAIEEVWAISTLEKTGEGRTVKFCGFELERAPNGDGFIVSQRKYEQEMVKRFGIEKSADFPNFKLDEEDEFPEEPAKPADVKTAQSMAGALLWLTTRTRPDVALSVAAACRLATKNPPKSIEIATAVMRYVRGVPGGLHYAGTVPENDWGRRQQLKVKRHDRLLEVFADIAFGVGSRHRSLQGIIIYFAGSPVAWASSQQPFVTYSTAESELVSYGEGLTAGRAMLALLCSMMDVAPTTIEKIIYGDNSAAISMAHGTGTSSWRTRHLRVRASFLKEALDGVTPDGPWKLFHLRGTELVADGLTKPLHGQAFFRFLEDLGMERRVVPNEVDESGTEVHGGGDNGAAMRAMIIGSMILSAAEAAQEEGQEDSDFAPLFLAGALLMALGAYQAGQLLHSASKCCLRRLRSWCREDELADLMRPEGLSRRNQEIVVVSEEEDPNDSSGGGTESGGSIAATSNRKMTRSGSGSVSSAGATSSVPLQRQSGSGTSTLTQRPRSGSSKDGSLSLPPLPHSGSCAGVETSTLTHRPRSGFGDGASTLRAMPHSGFGASAAGEPAAGSASSSASAAAGVGSVDVANVSKGGSKGPRPANPWNAFQNSLRGKGLSSTIMSTLYKQDRSKDV